ncbi:peptidase S15, partial [Streptomyces sp. T-3]|nr:peptidase S15 [Streptomyces sp. T-3]
LGELYARWAHLALAGELEAGRRGVTGLGGSPLWLPAGTAGESRTQHVKVLYGASFTADPEQPVKSQDLTVPTGGTADRCLLVTPPLPRPLDLVGPAQVRLRATADTP